MCAAFSDLNAVRSVLSGNNEIEAKLKQQIQQRMGEASKAVFDNGEVTWKRSKDSVVLDVPELLINHPEFLKTLSLG